MEEFDENWSYIIEGVRFITIFAEKVADGFSDFDNIEDEIFFIKQLEIKLEECISIENYELCSEIRDIIKIYRYNERV